LLSERRIKMAVYRFYGLIDVEIEADTEEEALAEFDDCMDDIVASSVDCELIEE
jgi:hypothetical protein